MTQTNRARRQFTVTFATVAASILLTACGSPTPAPSSTPEAAHATTPARVDTPTASSSSASNGPSSTSAGLVRAVHHQCDFGDRILRYLATGDNRGDPQLDTNFSQYVGVSLPRARSIADQAIEQCDAAFTEQEAAQASAAASAQAAASRAAADAQASAQAVRDKATRVAREQKECAPLRGTVQDGGSFVDLCVSTSPGVTTDGGNVSCSLATIPFQKDGTLAAADVANFRSSFPGCFP